MISLNVYVPYFLQCRQARGTNNGNISEVLDAVQYSERKSKYHHLAAVKLFERTNALTDRCFLFRRSLSAEDISV